MAASLLTTGCGGGADVMPADPAASLDPAQPVHSAPQLECASGTDAVPPEPAEAFSPVLPVQPAPPGEADPGEAAPPDEIPAPATVPAPATGDPDPCGLSVSRTAEPGEAAEALEYWTPERMESAIPEMPTVDR